VRDRGSGRRRSPAGTSSSSGPCPARATAPSGPRWLVPFGTRQDYYEQYGPIRHRPLPPSVIDGLLHQQPG